MTNHTNDIRAMLDAAIAETGVQLQQSSVDLAVYTTARAAHLAGLLADPDYQVAAAAELRAVALRAGIAAVETADAAEARIIGLLQGALTLTARILAPV